MAGRLVGFILRAVMFGCALVLGGSLALASTNKDPIRALVDIVTIVTLAYLPAGIWMSTRLPVIEAWISRRTSEAARAARTTR